MRNMRQHLLIVGIAVLCALCVLASLSGLRSSSAQHSELSSCLTATKIRRWETALLGWGRAGSPECVDAVQAASRHLVNANRTLSGAASALDLAADGEAQKLMQDAALKCGQVVP